MNTAERLDDDEPITLAEACRMFSRAKLTPSTLRAEHARGRLVVFRLGKRDYTTPRSMRDMVRKCQDENRRQNSMSTEANGASETERIESAQAALNQTVRALRGSSSNTSLPSTSRRPRQTR